MLYIAHAQLLMSQKIVNWLCVSEREWKREIGFIFVEVVAPTDITNTDKGLYKCSNKMLYVKYVAFCRWSEKLQWERRSGVKEVEL